MSRQPFLMYLLVLIPGILFQEYTGWAVSEWILILYILCALAVVLFFKNLLVTRLRSAILGVFFFLLGSFLHAFYSEKPELPELKTNEELIFSVEKKLNSTEKSRRYVISFEKEKKDGKAVLSVPKEKPELDYKHVYKAELYITKPFSPDNNFQFNYAKYLARQHIYFQMYISGDIQLAEQKNPDWLTKLNQHRFYVLQNIEQSAMSPQSRNFLKGIILADRTELDSETVQDFNRSGLMHFLAISGTHIVIIYWILMLVLKHLFPVKYRNYGIVVSLLLIWLFSLYIGFGNSVMRSCVMITVYYIYVLLQRKPDLLHSLSLAGLFILFCDTRQLFDIGFQLSFLAVFGIFWLNIPILNYLPHPKNLFQKVLFNTFSISASAQLVTIPFVLYYFHKFSWMSVPANIFIVPLSEIVIVSSFLMTILLGIGVVPQFLVSVYDVVIKALLSIIHWFANQDFAFAKNIPMSIAEVLYCFLMFYFLRFLILKFNLKNILTAVSLVIGFIVLRYFLTFYEDSKSEQIVVNHFKNEILIEKKKNNAVFYYHENIDFSSLEKNIINPYLTSRRLKNYELKPLNDRAINVNGRIIEFKNNRK
ncbi:MAG: ComEC/Rec2 family competence protein [Bergeyella sp.]